MTRKTKANIRPTAMFDLFRAALTLDENETVNFSIASGRSFDGAAPGDIELEFGDDDEDGQGNVVKDQDKEKYADNGIICDVEN